MKFSALTTACMLLVGITDAAYLEVSYSTGPGIIPVYSTVHVGNDGGKTIIGGLFDGCKNNIGGIQRICIDAGKSRAHVNYKSGIKRCFRVTSSKVGQPCPGGGSGCHGQNEVFCPVCSTWKYTQATCDW